MIAIILVLLVVIFAGLLIDWPKLLKQKSKQNSHSKPAKASLLQFKGKSATKKEEPGGHFDFDMTAEEEEAVDQVVVEEVEEPAYESDSEVMGLLAEADVCFRKGEMKAAEQFYLQAAAKDPRCSKAYSRLGVIYLENGDNWEDAEAAFRQALKTDAQNGFILNNLGLVLYHQDRYADAIRQFEQAVRQDELNAARQANLGMAYMAMRQYAKAESSFKKALKLAPAEMEYKDLLNESIEKKKAHKTMIRR
ncbi:MAG: tetratricopeptide repeat protein [bacterium]